MPSFDTVCEPNMVEVKNAVDNAAKEIGTRFDFKGTSAAIEVKDKEITLTGDADFQLQQVEDILTAKLAKRSVDVRFLDKGDIQKAGGDKVFRPVFGGFRGHEIACDLLAYEFVERFVRVERGNDVIAIAPGVFRKDVVGRAHHVGVTRQI